MTKDFSIKDIADIIDVSKTTVRKAIQKEGIDFDYIKSNKQYYSEEKTKKIIISIKADFDFANSQFQFANSDFENTNSQEKAEISKTENGNSKTDTANSQSVELLLLQQTVEMLGKQLAEKDKQLERKDEQINALNERLKEALSISHELNYITATDKTTQLLKEKAEEGKEETKDIIEEVEAIEKKSIFAKFFKK